MTDRELQIVRAALEAAAVASWKAGMDEHTKRRGAAIDCRETGSKCADVIRALDPAAIVAGVPEFSVAAGFRHVPEDVHRLIVQERDALRARACELEKTIKWLKATEI